MDLETIRLTINTWWEYLLIYVSLFDLVAMFLCLIGVVLGVRRGMTKIFSSVIVILIVQVVTLEYYGFLAAWVYERMPVPVKILEMILFWAIVFVVTVVSRIILHVFSFLAKINFPTFVNSLGGSVFGGIRAAMMVSLLSNFLLMIPYEPIQKIYETAVSGPFFSRLSPEIHKTAMNLLPVPDQFRGVSKAESNPESQ